LRITASHGFAVDALIKQLNADNVPVEINYRSSLEAVAALAHNECDLAGFHVPVGEFKQAGKHYLKWLDPKQHALIHLAYRTQGLFIAKGNPKKIKGLADLAAQRPALRQPANRIGHKDIARVCCLPRKKSTPGT